MQLTGTLTTVFVSMLAFVGGHLLLSWPPVRSRLVGVMGEALFSIAYSALMVVLLVWVIAAYRVAPPLVIYDLGRWVNLVPIVAMPFALILVVLGLASRNPTTVGGERALQAGLQPAGILTVTRHPFLVGVTIWAIAHLIANGDAASIMLFGGMAVLAVVGMAGIDHKRALRLGKTWDAFVAKTSRFPFAAAAAGRTRLDWAGIGWLRPLVGLVLYVVLYMLHDRLFGVPVVIV
ncbi:MAG TPA: NnrU family protein [Burkholderiales bacterium]|nr:NnrU family protein [Burkholderiales bacterium]